MKKKTIIVVAVVSVLSCVYVFTQLWTRANVTAFLARQSILERTTAELGFKIAIVERLDQEKIEEVKLLLNHQMNSDVMTIHQSLKAYPDSPSKTLAVKQLMRVAEQRKLFPAGNNEIVASILEEIASLD